MKITERKIAKVDYDDEFAGQLLEWLGCNFVAHAGTNYSYFLLPETMENAESDIENLRNKINILLDELKENVKI